MDDDVIRASNILKDFILTYSEVSNYYPRLGVTIPKTTVKKQDEIKQKIGENKLAEVDSALETCLKAIRSDFRKKEKDRKFGVLDERVRIVLCFLGEIRYSARRLFQYGLVDFMAMRKTQWKKTDGDTPNLRCGNVEWAIAESISNYERLESSSLEYMVSRMEEAISMSEHDSDTRFVDSMKKTLETVQAIQNASQGSWESRFLNIMESRLMRCGVGKVYRDGLAIFVNSASPGYFTHRTSSEDISYRVEYMLNKTLEELPQLPLGYKISTSIEEISSTMKKITFVING